MILNFEITIPSGGDPVNRFLRGKKPGAVRVAGLSPAGCDSFETGSAVWKFNPETAASSLKRTRSFLQFSGGINHDGLGLENSPWNDRI
jgi:hypothetical protein